MPRSSYGSGTIFKRGVIWHAAYWVNRRQVQKSSRSVNTFRTQNGCGIKILGRKVRGEMVNRHVERITCGELLDDFIKTRRGEQEAVIGQNLEVCY